MAAPVCILQTCNEHRARIEIPHIYYILGPMFLCKCTSIILCYTTDSKLPQVKMGRDSSTLLTLLTETRLATTRYLAELMMPSGTMENCSIYQLLKGLQ